MNATRPYWWLVNIGSGNGLVSWGSKPLPEPMLTQICVHMASLGHNELINSLRPGTHQRTNLWFVQVMACNRTGDNNELLPTGSLWINMWNQNATVFFQENLFENAASKMSAILLRPQWVMSLNTLRPEQNGRHFGGNVFNVFELIVA